MGGGVCVDEGPRGEHYLVVDDIVADEAVAGGEEGDTTWCGVSDREGWLTFGRYTGGIPPSVSPATPTELTLPPEVERFCASSAK